MGVEAEKRWAEIGNIINTKAREMTTTIPGCSAGQDYDHL
jgi:hypothetical protein